MAKHKATILIDEDEWRLFQNHAAILGTSCTAILASYIHDTVYNTLSFQQRMELERKIKEHLKSNIEDGLIQAISDLVAEKLAIKDSGFNTVDTVDVKTADDTTDTADTASTVNTSDTANTVSTASVVNVADTAGTGNTAIIANTADTANTADNSSEKDEKLISDRNRTALNSRTYSDAEVGSSESLSQSSVCRYRTGNRQPKDLTFWERWQVCDWNNKRWVKV